MNYSVTCAANQGTLLQNTKCWQLQFLKYGMLDLRLIHIHYKFNENQQQSTFKCAHVQQA